MALSPRPAAHDDAIADILATVRATAARIDALKDTQGPEHETAKELALTCPQREMGPVNPMSVDRIRRRWIKELVAERQTV